MVFSSLAVSEHGSKHLALGVFPIGQLFVAACLIDYVLFCVPPFWYLPIGMIAAVEPRRTRVRRIAMLQSLLSVIVETLFTATINAIVKFFGWEQAAERAGAVFGLGCIVIGFTIWWPGN